MPVSQMILADGGEGYVVISSLAAVVRHDTCGLAMV